ncbi:hypothetical protein [Streptomyces sp. NPDC127039]|uniref:hypothetical protein n=1 Tax=Streptomyces sp. NPDC127039 TaxID=3347115 RepID=UPI0036646FEC
MERHGEPFEGTRQAKSMHVKGDTRLEDGSSVTVDVSVDQEKNCQGTIGAADTRADVRHTDATLYLRGDEQYWRTALEQQPDAARKMAPKLQDKWVKMPANDATTAGVCDKQGVNGQEALALTKDASGGEKLTLYEQPPADRTVDLKELAGEQQT